MNKKLVWSLGASLVVAGGIVVGVLASTGTAPFGVNLSSGTNNFAVTWTKATNGYYNFVGNLNGQSMTARGSGVSLTNTAYSGSASGTFDGVAFKVTVPGCSFESGSCSNISGSGNIGSLQFEGSCTLSIGTYQVSQLQCVGTLGGKSVNATFAPSTSLYPTHQWTAEVTYGGIQYSGNVTLNSTSIQGSLSKI